MNVAIYLLVLVGLLATILKLFFAVNTDIAQNKADKVENKSGSVDYVYKRNENPDVIGGTNLDRFFVECVMSRCNDFTVEKNIAKAKLLADKYNLSYSAGIETLFEQALKAHEKISDIIYNDILEKRREKERAEYNIRIKYAEYYGRDKRKAMLTDRMIELRNKAELLDKGAEMLVRGGQQQEQDWAIWGGIANGIAGPGAGVSTALDIQARNVQIRAQNEANMRATMPTYMAATGNASQNRTNANVIQKQIEALDEKLLSDMKSSEVMKLLEVTDSTVDVSRTGAFKVTATVRAKEKLLIYGDVPAIADGTIQAHVFDDTHEIGTVKMVLPVDGVSEKVGIVGMGLVGAEPGKTYNVTFTDYKLWLMEK